MTNSHYSGTWHVPTPLPCMRGRADSFRCYAVSWILIGLWAGMLVYLSLHLFGSPAIAPVEVEVDKSDGVHAETLEPAVDADKDQDDSAAQSLEAMIDFQEDDGSKNVPRKDNLEPAEPVSASVPVPEPLNPHPANPLPGFDIDTGAFLVKKAGVTKCDKPYGFSLLEEWNGKAQTFCGGGGGEGKGRGRGRLTCRVTVQPHLPPATAPHALCDGDEIIVDFSKFSSCQAPVERAEYGLGNMVHNCYAAGAFGAKCKKDRAVFTPDKFPRDHLKDIFKSFAEVKDGSSSQYEKSEAKHTVFVTREGGEYANLFHTMTDWMNIFQTLAVMEWKREDVQIVFLDNNPKLGPFDKTWSDVFAPKHGIKRVNSFGSKTVVFEKAAFSPPGYSSVLFNYVNGGNPCKEATGLMRTFKYYFINSLGYTFGPVLESGSELTVTLVSRKPYTKNGVEHSYMARQLGNQDELVELIRRTEGVRSVEAVDFAQIDFRQQVDLVTRSDILVGVHGAALSHMCWLPEHGGVLELTQDPGVWNLFENMAYMNGVTYTRWDNTNAANFVENNKGSVLTVDTLGFEIALKQTVEIVRERKQRFVK